MSVVDMILTKRRGIVEVDRGSGTWHVLAVLRIRKFCEQAELRRSANAEILRTDGIVAFCERMGSRNRRVSAMGYAGGVATD